MRITLATAGGFGDTQPFIPLGQALQRAGHEVSVLCVGELAGWIESYGLPTLPYDWSVAQALQPELMEAWQSTDDVRHKEVIAIWAKQIAEAAVDPFEEAMATSDAAVVGSIVMPLALQVHARHRRPMAFLQHTPSFATRRGDSHFGAPDSRRRWRYLLDGMRASAGMLDALMPGLAVAADRLGERPLSPAALWRALLTTPMFTAVSPVLAPAHARNPWLPTTGYLFLRSNTTLSPEVLFFLDAGDAPVFFGLGSITSTAAREHTERMLDSVLATGGRVIAPRLAGVDESAYDPKRVLFIGFEPFDQLFERCSLLMHHGGVGTEALGFVAEVPQFITPLTIDHWYFGRRAHELGVAPAPVHLDEVSDADVRSAIEFAGLPEVRARARELGAQIRTEDGAGNAVRFLTRALRLL